MTSRRSHKYLSLNFSHDQHARFVFLTRVFTNGNSQAVRIPREYRLSTGLVQISENEDGDLVLHPIADEPKEREAHLTEILDRFDAADIAAFEEAHRDQGVVQERDTL